MKSNLTRPLAGLVLVAAIIGIFAAAVGLFRGSFTPTVPVTVISDRAGLVMNPDAKVKMRGVQVGKVATIQNRADGKAALLLEMDPSALNKIPSNVAVDISSSTVFGAKSVEFNMPTDPSTKAMYAGQVIENQHVTVEVNTVFQQLVNVLDKINPAKLNETLGAIAQAFDGRGEKIGRTLTDLNALLAKLDPSLPMLSHDIEAAVPTLSAYADAAPDLMATLGNTTRISDSVVDDQQQLDEFLVSTIGLADVGNDVIGSNREALSRLLQVLLPTTDLANRYHEMLGCIVGGLVPFAKSVPQYSAILFLASLTMGTERYRYPQDLPKVAAKSGNLCQKLGLPELPPDFRVPGVVSDVGINPFRYNNQGILLNSDGLKQWLFGPIPGPPRNTAQVGMPG